MKITTPEEMTTNISFLERVILDFEKQLKNKSKNYQGYSLSSAYECDENICKEIENIYKQAGWINVKCTIDHRQRTNLVIYKK